MVVVPELMRMSLSLRSSVCVFLHVVSHIYGVELVGEEAVP